MKTRTTWRDTAAARFARTLLGESREVAEAILEDWKLDVLFRLDGLEEAMRVQEEKMQSDVDEDW